MERALPCALFLLLPFLLGGTAGESGGGTCHLGPYGELLPDDPLQCPGRLDGSGESSSEAAPASPEGCGEARAGDPPAKETGRPWSPISGVSAEVVSRSPTVPKGAGILLMDGEQCHRWAFGQASPIESFQCPTQRSHREDLFCCGTCTISYCCSSPKRRLEQESCPKIMEELGDQGAEESTGPPPEKPAGISNIGLILVLSAVMCLCIWMVCFCLQFRDWRINRNEQRRGNQQREVIREILPEAAVDHPGDEQQEELHELLPEAAVDGPGDEQQEELHELLPEAAVDSPGDEQQEELHELLPEAAVDRPGDEQQEELHELLPEAAVDGPGDEQQEELHELLPEAAVHPPASFQGPEESPRSSKLPPSVASPPDGSGSPMDEEVSPAVPPEGNLELPPEEEETVL